MTTPSRAAADAPNPGPGATTTPGEGPRGTRRGVFCATVLAIVGGAAALLAGPAIDAIGEVFQLPPELARLGRGGPPGPADQQRISAGNLVLRYKHTALWLGATGAILGGSFGLVLGLFRRSKSAAVAGLIWGLVFGKLFGAAAGFLVVYIDRYLQTHVPDGQLTVPEHMVIIMHAATWLVIGLGVGLGSGLGARTNRGRTAAGSMLVAAAAGLLGGVLYPVVVGMALPLADPSQVLPRGDWERLLWLGLPSVLMGLALGRKG